MVKDGQRAAQLYHNDAVKGDVMEIYNLCFLF